MKIPGEEIKMSEGKVQTLYCVQFLHKNELEKNIPSSTNIFSTKQRRDDWLARPELEDYIVRRKYEYYMEID